MIDFSRDLLAVGIESFDLLHSTTPAPWYRRWINKWLKRGVYSARNVKDFGATALQELERLGIDVIILVSTPAELFPVREIINNTPLLVNLRVDIVPPSMRIDWSVSRGAQFLKSYEQLKQIMSRLDDNVEEERK